KALGGTTGGENAPPRVMMLLKTLKDANPDSELAYYEPAPLPADGVDLSETADRAIWLALLAPDKVSPATTRSDWSGKTLGLGLAPRVADVPGRTLFAGGASARVTAQAGGWTVELAYLNAADRDRPGFRTLRTVTVGELKDEPAAYAVPLPPDFGAVEPPRPTDAFDQGSGFFPPELEEKDKARLVAWLRLTAQGSAFTGVRWAGANAVAARQSRAVRGEVVGTGTGEPDQEFSLSQQPVVPGSVKVRVRRDVGSSSPWDEWAEIDDLLAAGPQTVAGASDPDPTRPSRVFQTDPEAGLIRFGDGLRGARPGLGLPIRADYEVSAGRAGNVGAGQIQPAGDVPEGVTAANPLPARGGGDAQSPADAERLIPKAVRHRDRLVTPDDYRDIVLSAPGAGVGRVEVLPLYAPVLGASLPGDVPGAVTLLLVPLDDPARPDAPSPTPEFVAGICA
ncbi:MAG: hypothetical protein K2V38_15895, partial [Gemmataceae bacterium]|nr:hypothetical protein [Gemmataceae bacterium]